MEEDRVFKIARSISQQLMDHGDDVELFDFEEAPFGVNVNRYDGIILGGSEDSFFGVSPILKWIDENLEILKKKETAFFFVLLKSYILSECGLKNSVRLRVSWVSDWVPDSSVLFCFPEDHREQVCDVNAITSEFSDHYAQVVGQTAACGLTFQSSFKREYLHNGIKLGFP